jgi:hypothetical protein
MKTIPLVFAAFTVAAASVRSEDAVSSDITVVPEASIPGPISDGTPSLPPPAPEPIPFHVETSVTKRVHVVESPEMPGLPAPEGDINITVQLVKDPGLPDPPPPMPPAPPDDPAVMARMAELAEKYRETQLVFVSATVYDHYRTFLRCYPSGNGHREEISAWSNLDFNHFSGFATFEVKGTDGETRQYGLVMALGNEEIVRTRLREQRLDEHEIEFEPVEIPQLPDLATSGPAFVVKEGDTTNRESMELIEGMHTLYRTEGARMEQAYHARIKAYEDRKAFLLANPPKPKDVTIQFWDREKPSPAGLQIIEGKVQP